MERTLEQPHSVWHAQSVGWHAPLADSVETSVCVIGGGVSGLCVALELSRRGVPVVVLDARIIAHGQTSRSTAHLVTALDERYFSLARAHGASAAHIAARAHTRAIQWLENMAHEESIDASFRRVTGDLVVPENRSDDRERFFEAELAAATSAGIECSLIHSASQLVTGHGASHLQFPNQAVCDPVVYLDGLADAIVRKGGRIFTQTSVTNVEKGNTVRTESGHTVRATHIIYACHQPPKEIEPGLRSLTPVTSYAMAYALAADAHPNPSPEASVLLWDGYWDDPAVPYHYLRIARTADGEPMLVIGGDDRESKSPGDAPKHFAAINAWTRMNVPAAGGTLARWWGRILEPDGEFALIGPVPELENRYVIAGDSGNGFTYAAIAAEHLADRITGADIDEEIAALHAPIDSDRRSQVPFEGRGILMA